MECEIKKIVSFILADNVYKFFSRTYNSMPSVFLKKKKSEEFFGVFHRII